MAAPTPIETTTNARVHQINDARSRKSKLIAEQTPDEVAVAWAEASSDWEEKYRAAVMRTLLADLATWPRAFQRIGEHIQTWGSPDFHWEHFRRGRERGTQRATPAPGDCSCGCVGFNDLLARELERYRTAAAQVTAATKTFVRKRRVEQLDESKTELLRLLWEHGVRRIDRSQMREHLAETVQTECAELRGYIKGCAASVQESRARLREDRTHNKHGATDRPLSPGARLAFERDIVESPKLAAKHRTRLAELEALLADPFALARVRTGCFRATVVA